LAQDDYWYEIHLSNKQLVFYFMAGATGLILSFLAGVMVGRGVDSAVAEAQPIKQPVREERIVTEESPRPAAPPSAEELSYARRLESDKPEESLDRAGAKTTSEKSGAPDKSAGKTSKPEVASRDKGPAKEPASVKAPGKDAAAAVKEPQPATSAAVKPPKDTAAKDAPAPKGTFTIQVGAFKDKSSADSVAQRLKTKGFSAYVISPDGAEGGLFNVRVGSYSSKVDAERVETRLRDEEKFKPFIVKP